ncbi:hypothetical protein V8E52_002798 [Russula decolorans]
MHRQLPWSTANEDLVQLFGTTGQVELILFDGTRYKGAGVVQSPSSGITWMGEDPRWTLQ